MIAVFYAMEGEIGEPLPNFVQKGEAIRPERWHREDPNSCCVIKKGEYHDKKIILVQTGIWVIPGVGNFQSKEVAEYLFNEFSIKRVIIVGTSGGMKEELKNGDIVVCKPICAEGKKPLHPNRELYSLAKDTLRKAGIKFYVKNNLTIPFYAMRLEERREIARKHPEAWVIEMENYFIASVAKARKAPFLAVRVVNETFEEVIVPKEERDPIEQLRMRERFLNARAILTHEFLLPFLQRL